MFNATLFEKVLTILTPLIYFIGLSALAFQEMKYEQKRWNSGVCRQCHSPWIKSTASVQGKRGYHCACGCHIWISYPVDK